MNPQLAHFSGQEVKANEKEWKFYFSPEFGEKNPSQL